MMGVTSLEVYNTVYNITEKNNKLQIFRNDEQFDALDINTVVMLNMKKLYESYEPGHNDLNEIIEKAKISSIACYESKKKLTKNDFDYLKQINSNVPITIPNIEIVNESIEIQLTPGAYELVDINTFIKRQIKFSVIDYINKLVAMSKSKKNKDFGMECSIIPETISRKSVLTTSNPIHFNSELNKLLGFTLKDYPSGTHTSEKPVMISIISIIDKVLLKCDFVDGSIVNCIREQNLVSFNLGAPPGNKIIREPTTVLYKKQKQNTTGHHSIFP